MKGKTITIKFQREEALACAIALSKEKRSYLWQQQALSKIDKKMGFK